MSTVQPSNGQLPPRDKLVPQLEAVVRQFERPARFAQPEWKGENTWLCPLAAAGIVGWLERTFGFRKSLIVQQPDGVSVRELLDEAYRAA